MILKNFINLFNIKYLLLFLCILYLINNFIFNTNLRRKFLLLITLLTLFSGIGVYYGLDGMVMIFFIAELTVILVFVVMFSQLYSYNIERIKQNNLYIFAFLIIISINYYDVNLVSYKNYYSHYVIVLNDFYYIYNTYFEKQIMITLLITIIITLYSIFFILLYFNIKKTTNNEMNFKKNIYLLRKQNSTHQSNYKTKIKFFKNKLSVSKKFI